MFDHSYNRGARYDGKPERPYPWERSEMTICIAAVCNASREGGTKIIVCTDWRQTSPIGTADTLHKQKWLPKGWICLTAGTTTEINALVQILSARFQEEGEIDETNIVGVVQDSLRERLKAKRDEYSYGEFSRNYDEITNTGKNILPQDMFSIFMQQASQIDVGAELIIAGFAGSDDFIIETTRRGKVHLPTDFSCIGEGEYLAQASLLQRSFTGIRDFGPALYEVYEAKKAAQNVNSVSQATLMKVLNSDGTHYDVKQESFKLLDQLYREYGPKDVPILMDVPDGLFW